MRSQACCRLPDTALSHTPTSSALAEAFHTELAGAPALRWRLSGLGGGSAPFLLASLLARLARPALVLAADSRRAEELLVELETVLGELPELTFLQRRLHLLPAREAPPLEPVSPPLELEASRIAALYQLARMKAPIIVSSPEAMALRTLPPEALDASALYLVVDDELDLGDFMERCTGLGYRRTGLVEETGQIAVRGGVIDVWPAGAEHPLRVEMFGDTIESIRVFDAADQRSFNDAEDVTILPVSTVTGSRLGDPKVRRAVHERANELMLAASERRQIDANLAAAAWFPGAELFMPYLYDRTAWLADYLPAAAPVFVLDPPAVEAAVDSLGPRLQHAEAAAREAGSFFPEVERLYVAPASLRALLGRRPLVELDAEHGGHSRGTAGDRVWCLDAHGHDGLAAARAQVRASRGEHRFLPMVQELEGYRRTGSRLVVLAADRTQLDRLEHLLSLSSVPSVVRAVDFRAALAADPATLSLVQGHLRRGFRLGTDGLVVITDEEIFGQRRRVGRRRKVGQARLLTALNELKPGDYMVHVDHGIGIYRGLKHIVAGGTEGDFIHLEYAGGDRYYLPVDRINLVEKYTGSGSSAPPVSRLGSPAWTRTKQRAKESILRLAHELLDVEAFRAVHTREPIGAGGADFEEFEARFPFEETDGQKAAVADITRDLVGEKPMDRLVCGDVGYGKTEVAIRGAYLMVMAGKQVAFLVPTTVLARQHFDTLQRRFDGYPVRVAMLSRFQSRLGNREVAAGLASGQIDVVVGTHRLLQRDIGFARLGLLVVDEEHRFGVKAKERIKNLRREVDVLTMTATPIPRTLQLALSGVRDLSLIETPPVDRLAIRTYVARYDEGLIKQSIEREVGRAGQVFFVHNRVASIEAVARRVQELVPRARLAVAHGQMNEADLERHMLAFLGGEIDVLVCTSIIESGLDIPNANTILINRADTFGLAQLYQIRGRVGRSHRRAYAYLLVPGEQLITEEARRRLDVLQELDGLGSGFRIAAHDMEIRGAGNLLGKEQSGHVAAVGFELFMQLMEESTRELRGETSGPRIEPEIELGSEAYLPEGYIDDIGERLLLYKRMANAASAEVLREIAEELADRFGPLPRQVEDFLRIMALRPTLKQLAVESLKGGEDSVSLRFHELSPLDPNLLVRLATEQPKRFRVRPGGVLTMRFGLSDAETGISWDGMVDRIEGLLADLLAAGVLPLDQAVGDAGRS